jgi:hypothetical protein
MGSHSKVFVKITVSCLFVLQQWSCSSLESFTRKGDLEEIQQMMHRARGRFLQRVSNTLPYRFNGYAYAIDLGNILRFAAATNDRQLFDSAYAAVMKYYLMKETGDAKADYTLLWRTKPGQFRDASGSAETINAAEGFWRGYERWNDLDLKSLAQRMAIAYLGHGSWTDDGRFYVKNYYNYVTKTYSENTWLLNQMPHVLLRIGRGCKDTNMVNYAIGMAKFLRNGIVFPGISKEMYDPGIGTVIPGQTGYYAPDGFYAFLSTVDVNKGLLPFYPKLAPRFIDWVSEHLNDLRGIYFFDVIDKKFRPTETTSISLMSKATFLQIVLDANEKTGEYSSLRDYFVLWQILPALREWVDKPEQLDTYTFEMPIVFEALTSYLDQVARSER